MRILRRTMLLVVVAAFASYLLALGFLFVRQRAMIYLPQPPVPVKESQGREVLEVVAGDLRVPMRWRKAREGQRTLVQFHGNAEQIGELDEAETRAAATGLGFAAVEYPGYGGTAGSPTEQGILAVARAGVARLVAAGVPNTSLVLVGRSLGSGVAARLASEGLGGRVVLVSPYTSLVDVAAWSFPFVPVRLIMRDRFDTASVAPRVTQPALVVHGTVDDVIPFQQGEMVSKLLRRADFVVVKGAGHGDVLTDDVWRQVLDFASAP